MKNFIYSRIVRPAYPVLLIVAVFMPNILYKACQNLNSTKIQPTEIKSGVRLADFRFITAQGDSLCLYDTDSYYILLICSNTSSDGYIQQLDALGESTVINAGVANGYLEIIICDVHNILTHKGLCKNWINARLSEPENLMCFPDKGNPPVFLLLNKDKIILSIDNDYSGAELIIRQ